MRGAAPIVQALAQVYLGPMDESYYPLQPERAPGQLSAAAAAAYTTGVKALLAHEAALHQDVTFRCDSLTSVLALICWPNMRMQCTRGCRKQQLCIHMLVVAHDAATTTIIPAIEVCDALLSIASTAATCTDSATAAQ